MRKFHFSDRLTNHLKPTKKRISQPNHFIVEFKNDGNTCQGAIG